MDPEAEFRSQVEQRTYRGVAGFVQYRNDVDAVMEDFHTEEDRFLEVGSDRVLHLYRVVGRGAGSGTRAKKNPALSGAFLSAAEGARTLDLVHGKRSPMADSWARKPWKIAGNARPRSRA
jgi:hypothetical protein